MKYVMMMMMMVMTQYWQIFGNTQYHNTNIVLTLPAVMLYAY